MYLLTWMKKGSGLFDVTMGAFRGAELCELVGTLLLHKLSQKYDKNNITSHGDDGLTVFKNISFQNQKILKKFSKIA